MDNKLPALALLLVIIVFVYSFSQKDGNKGKPDQGNIHGIRFIESNWSVALQEARKQNKLIFLDAYASWCGPCKLLKKNTFTDKEAGEFFNKNFINVAIDMEKGEGPALLQKFGVSAYPTLIITDAYGNSVTYTEGYIAPKQLIEFGEYGITHYHKQ